MQIVELWGIRALSLTSLESHWSRWDGEVGQLTPGQVEAWQRDKAFTDRLDAIAAEWNNE